MSREDVPFEIRPSQLAAWREADEEHLLLDVREPDEHALCRIEGARFLPMREIPHRLEELDPEQTIVVYCHSGMRSAQVVGYLRQQGFSRATNLGGGIDAWSLEVDPEVPRY